MQIYRKRYIDRRAGWVGYTRKKPLLAFLRRFQKVTPVICPPRPIDAKLLCLGGQVIRRGFDNNWLRRVIFIIPMRRARRTRWLECV